MESILLVEPYAELRSAIASALDRAHYRCEAVGSAADAMLKLRSREYAYILVDIDSPDPMPALYTALNDDPGLLAKVIVITDGETTNLIAQQPQIRKPFDRDELLASFKTWSPR